MKILIIILFLLPFACCGQDTVKKVRRQFEANDGYSVGIREINGWACRVRRPNKPDTLVYYDERYRLIRNKVAFDAEHKRTGQ